MGYVPDHYRWPITLGTTNVMVSALDTAEIELGRDRHGPHSDRRACLPEEDERRLWERERRSTEHRRRCREQRPLLERLLP